MGLASMNWSNGDNGRTHTVVRGEFIEFWPGAKRETLHPVVTVALSFSEMLDLWEQLTEGLRWRAEHSTPGVRANRRRLLAERLSAAVDVGAAREDPVDGVTGDARIQLEVSR